MLITLQPNDDTTQDDWCAALRIAMDEGIQFYYDATAPELGLSGNGDGEKLWGVADRICEECNFIAPYDDFE